MSKELWCGAATTDPVVNKIAASNIAALSKSKLASVGTSRDSCGALNSDARNAL